MPGYKDIGKNANDLFDEGEYALTQEFEVSASEDNVSFNATTTMEGDDVTTAVEYNQGNIQVTANTNSEQTVSYDKIPIPLDMKAKLTYSRTAKESNDTLEAKIKCSVYGIELKAKTDFSFNVKTDFSYVFSNDAALVGIKVPTKWSKGFDANAIGFAAQYASGENTFALTSASVLNQQASLSLFRQHCDKLQLGFKLNYSPEALNKGSADMLNFGASYNLDGKSNLQGFANGAGLLRAKYSYDFSKHLTGSVAFESNINNPLAVRNGFRLQFS